MVLMVMGRLAAEFEKLASTAATQFSQPSQPSPYWQG
jgi:hypothetical protein